MSETCEECGGDMGGFHFTGCPLKYKSEPEHQAQMAWARGIVSKIVIPEDDSPPAKGAGTDGT